MLTLILDWQMVAADHKCKNTKDIAIWWVKDGPNDEKFPRDRAVDECGNRCNGISSMFRLTRCPRGFCRCICEISASIDGTCVLESLGETTGHRLYKYIPKGLVISS